MLCNGVLHANRAGLGTRGTERNAVPRIHREAPRCHSTPGEKGVGQTHWGAMGLQACCRDYVINVFEVLG